MLQNEVIDLHPYSIEMWILGVDKNNEDENPVYGYYY